jgi:hypothetical protein
VSGQRSLSVSRLRQGENAAIPFAKKVIPQAGGGALVEYSLDLATAPVPERRYTAERVLAAIGEDSARIIFGQYQLGGTSLRSVIVIHVSFDALRTYLAGFAKFLPPLRTFVETNTLHQPDPLELPTTDPAQAVVFTANIIATAYNSREACIDFYNASAFAFRAIAGPASGSGNLAVDPLVRVDLSTGALLSMIEQMEGFSADLPEPIQGGPKK